MNDRELMQAVLEAMESLHRTGDTQVFDLCYAPELIPALRERLAQPEQKPVAHSIVAGALFDFMGWLTSRRERLVLSSVDNSAPAADAIKDFAEMRGLSINDAQVQEWQGHLTTPPRREWVGLTDVERIDLCVISEAVSAHSLIGMVEAKLKEKNA